MAWNTDIATIVTAKISSICVITTRMSVTIGKNTNTFCQHPFFLVEKGIIFDHCL